MPKKPKLSDILEEAAQQFEDRVNSDPYSCNVVEHLISKYYDSHSAIYVMCEFEVGVEEMGLRVGSMTAFHDVPWDQRNQARALWLSWCAMMARDQGL